MKRRGFLKLLLALPFAPALAEAAAKAIGQPTIDMASGADQTSIWLVEWGKNHTLLDVANKYHYNSLPIVEALNQKNPFLQDMVWQEKNIKLGQNFLKARTTEQYKRKV